MTRSHVLPTVAAFLLGLAVALAGTASAQIRPHGGTTAYHYVWNDGHGHRWASNLRAKWLSSYDRGIITTMLEASHTPRWYVLTTPTPRPVATRPPPPTATPVPTATLRPTAAPFPTPRPVPTVAPPTCSGTADQCRTLQLVNADRASHGAGPLTLIQNATTDQHALDEVACGCIFHVLPAYPNESFPYGGFWAENTAVAYSVDQAEQAYMSEGPCPTACTPGDSVWELHGHYLNIINPQWHYLAVGIGYGTYYGTPSVYQIQDFR